MKVVVSGKAPLTLIAALERMGHEIVGEEEKQPIVVEPPREIEPPDLRFDPSPMTHGPERRVSKKAPRKWR